MSYSKRNIEQLATLNAWVTSCVVLLNLLMSFIAFSFPSFRSLSLVIFVSGTVGGAASNYRRLQEVYVHQLKKPAPFHDQDSAEDRQIVIATPEPLESDIDPEPETIAEKRPTSLPDAITEKRPASLAEDESTYFILKLQIFLSPVFGGLFAFVLYAAFVAGIIQGELFPKFKGAEDEYSTPYEFADNTLPATNADLSKAILWAFIAGFAEGFVPNFIDKLVKESEQE